MNEATAKFARQTGAGGFFAEVTLNVEPAEEASSIFVLTSGDGFQGQGNLESAPSEGYDEWKAGAVLGAKFALKAVHTSAVVRITRISGMSTDTNPSIVAAATALAIWKALGVPPPLAAQEQVEQAALSSWRNVATRQDIP